MKNLFYLLLLATLCACWGSDKPAVTVPETPETETPAPSPEATTESGSQSTVATPVPPANAKVANDLNGDGEPDHLDVITTKVENDGLGFKRQLVVYSGQGADLDAWYTAEDVILSTEHGGMMGDPLESAEIENGTIVIKHFGGSRTKWHYTHRFRWQNGDFKLIGTTIDYDDGCAEFTSLDYNLSTGNAEYSTTPQDCSGDEIKRGETIVSTFKRKMALPTMNGFKTGEHELKASGMKGAVYF